MLRAEQGFAEVAVGLLTGSPSAADALSTLASPVVQVLPFFMEQGWFVREALPTALAHAKGHSLRFHSPVGVHDAMSGLAAARAASTCGSPMQVFHVLLVGHGSASVPGRPIALHRHAARLAASGRFAAVRAGFLE